MSASLQHERDNVYRIDLTGVLQEHEFLAMQRLLAAELDGANRIRLLVMLTEFEGWERTATWRDLTFYVRHGNDIKRIAIVGDDRWRAEALMFAAADLRDAPVADFAAVRAAKARGGLSHWWQKGLTCSPHPGDPRPVKT